MPYSVDTSYRGYVARSAIPSTFEQNVLGLCTKDEM